MNEALIEEFGIDVVVTKASGTAGGFWEKVEAARACGIELVVIHRPLEEDGLTVDELKRELDGFLPRGMRRGCDSPQECAPSCPPPT